VLLCASYHAVLWGGLPHWVLQASAGYSVLQAAFNSVPEWRDTQGSLETRNGLITKCGYREIGAAWGAPWPRAGSPPAPWELLWVEPLACAAFLPPCVTVSPVDDVAGCLPRRAVSALDQEPMSAHRV